MKKLLLVTILAVSLLGWSCQKKILQGNTKILAGNDIYHYKGNSAGDPIVKYHTDSPLKAVVIEKEDMLFIKGLDVTGMNKVVVDPNPDARTTDFGKIQNKYYFPESKDKALTEQFVYRSSGVVVQALAIPFKFRGSVSAPSLPKQIETGFTGTLAAAWKVNRNTFRQQKNYLGKYTNTLSFAPGFIPLGLSAVDLSTTNTSPLIKTPRKALVYSAGGFLMFGINNINVGLAAGFDWATGSEAKHWSYQGKPWTGIIVGLDVLK